ncbi:hypothetical protein ElyMa_000702100 [Elysia marginata]|uniref:Uncharacterized protein n=1 Tax=Elysia marginata TaxID=1093978 RepID=A0AAV4GMM3_9GAST|nr:hypothetical protein ElyMa_000702100 [Elysia marginata]
MEVLECFIPGTSHPCSRCDSWWLCGLRLKVYSAGWLAASASITGVMAERVSVRLPQNIKEIGGAEATERGSCVDVCVGGWRRVLVAGKGEGVEKGRRIEHVKKLRESDRERVIER